MDQEVESYANTDNQDKEGIGDIQDIKKPTDKVNVKMEEFVDAEEFFE